MDPPAKRISPTRPAAKRGGRRSGRAGVVALDEWREALKAKQSLEKLLGTPDWLLGIRVAPSPTVGVRIIVTLLWDSAQGRVCVPSAVSPLS